MHETVPRNHIDFVIAGEPKSGTTALAQFLSNHPEVCVSVPKEPHYFATDHQRESDRFHGRQAYFHTRTDEEFMGLFSHAKPGETVYGEASTGYLYSLEAAQNIHDHSPDAKIIMMFREPVSFLHSLHMQYVNETVEDETDFEKALRLEKERKDGWQHIPKNVRTPSYLYYSERIKYAEQAQRFFDVFPSDQIMVVIHEDFRADNEGTFRGILDFLGVDPEVSANFKEVHGSKQPRFKRLNKMIHNPMLKTYVQKILGQTLYTRIHKQVNKVLLKPEKRSPISPELSKELKQLARPEVEKIGKLLNRDLIERWGYKD